jgi:hypothetical protein
MFKKINIFIFIFILFTGINVFAGDIPETVMWGNQKALFIGKIIAVNADTYSIVPSTVMMGNILDDELQIKKFDNYFGTDIKPKAGDFIVAILLDENVIEDTWVFKATTEDYRTLKLVSQWYDTVARYEKYINEGEYFEAQKRIDENAAVTTDADKTHIEPIESSDYKHKESFYPVNVILIAIMLSLFGCGILSIALLVKK